MKKTSVSAAPVPLEHEEQKALIEWWSYAARGFGCDAEQLFAIPNGSYKSRAAAAKFAAEGLRAGVPDLLLAAPAGKFHGLFIEMKRRRGGVVSDAQKQYNRILSRAGYKSVISRGADDAINAIKQYFSEV